MHEVVRSIFHSKAGKTLRLTSVAGTGLPERMRSAAFAFLGLTAAVGLTLVAFFAQLGFPLLSPAPLPGEPAKERAVAEAVALERSPAPLVISAERPRDARAAGEDQVVPGQLSPGGDDAVTPGAPAPQPPSGGGVSPGAEDVAQPAPGPGSAPAPTTVPDSNSAGSSSPAAQPNPAPAPKPAPTPARPSAPTPVASAGPGNSSSSAAAAHASDRGIEASSKSSATVESPSSTAAASPTPSPADSPGNGSGKALGHNK